MALVYTGYILYDWRKGDTCVDIKALDPLPPDVVAYNQRYGDIDADLADFEGDESLLNEGTGVRFTYI